jgi:hypothetical protein
MEDTVNRLLRLAGIPCLAFVAIAAYSVPAAADTATLEAGCTWSGGVDCAPKCKSLDVSVSCNAKLAADCTLPAKCNAAVDVNCTGSCSGTCESKCNVSPGSFDCRGNCSADCGAGCDGECQASTHGASSQADCSAKCKASCSAKCEGTCSGTPPTADCKAKCQGSCSGQCSTKANLDCNVKCAVQGSASCEASFKADCDANCSVGGVLVCDGAAKEFLATLEKAKAWLQAHGYASGSASAQCSGGSCTAQAEASAGAKCALAPTDEPGGWVLCSLALAAAVGGVVGRRRRARKA